MKLPKRLFALMTCAALSCANIATTGAAPASASGVTHGVLTDYCHKLKAKIISNYASKITWDKTAVVYVALDGDGKIVDTSPVADAGTKDQQEALQMIKSMEGLQALPAGAKLPLWLTVALSKKTDDIDVTVRDIDFGPYMGELQRRIKRAWYPPKGNESERVTVIFQVDGGGGVSKLRLSKACGIPAADEAALTAVKNAKPFDSLPDGSPDTVDIQFTFDYNVFKKSGGGGSGAGSSANSTSNKGSGDGAKVSGSGSSHTDDKRSDSASGAALFVTQGMKALDRKDYQMAIQFFQSAVGLDAENATAKKSLSIAYTSFGSEMITTNPELALDSFHKAKKYWPENPMTPDTLEQAAKLFGKSIGTGGGATGTSQSENDKAK